MGGAITLIVKFYFLFSNPFISNINPIGYIIFIIKPARSPFSPQRGIAATIPVINGATEQPISPKIAIAPYMAPLPSGNFLAAISTVAGHRVLMAKPQSAQPASATNAFLEIAATT